MGRRAQFPPKIHTRRGMDFLRLSNGDGTERHRTLGPAGSEKSRSSYARIVAELSAGRPSPFAPRGSITVSMLCLSHLEWSEGRYDYRQHARVKKALQPVSRLFGSKPASEFGPLALERVRAEYVRSGYCRKLCNQMVGCVRLAWRRAAGREQVEVSVADALYRLANLYRGEIVGGIVPSERDRVPAVAREAVEQTLPRLGRIVADMVRLQLLTGARPGEICALRPRDIERPWKTIEGAAIWLYKLDTHKTDWRGKHRWIPLSPAAQRILVPYLDRPAEAYCFSPMESRLSWEAAKRAARKTRVQPSQANRRKERPRKQAGRRYSTQSYGHAIARACAAHGIPHWSPNQIRHLVLELIEDGWEQEDARCVAGHTTPTTTAVYARGVLRAARVLAKLK